MQADGSWEETLQILHRPPSHSPATSWFHSRGRLSYLMRATANSSWKPKQEPGNVPRSWACQHSTDVSLTVSGLLFVSKVCTHSLTSQSGHKVGNRTLALSTPEAPSSDSALEAETPENTDDLFAFTQSNGQDSAVDSTITGLGIQSPMPLPFPSHIKSLG